MLTTIKYCMAIIPLLSPFRFLFPLPFPKTRCFLRVLCRLSSYSHTLDGLIQLQQISKYGLQNPEGPWDTLWGFKVKTIFIIILRHYLPLLLSWYLQWWCKAFVGKACIAPEHTLRQWHQTVVVTVVFLTVLLVKNKNKKASLRMSLMKQ